MGFLHNLLGKKPEPANSKPASPVPEKNQPPQFSLCNNGLYQSGVGGVTFEGASLYLRFYDDGTVLSVTAGGKPEQVATWHNKANASSYKGQYKIHGSILEFTTTGKDDTFDYSGTLSGKELTLEEFSHRNGFAMKYVLCFVEIPGLLPD